MVDPAHNGPVPAMNKNATTWRIDFFLDTQGEFSYSPSQKKELLISHNLYYFMELTRTAAQAILSGQFSSFKAKVEAVHAHA